MLEQKNNLFFCFLRKFLLYATELRSELRIHRGFNCRGKKTVNFSELNLQYLSLFRFAPALILCFKCPCKLCKATDTLAV